MTSNGIGFSPDGTIDRRIALPVPRVTSLAFGGVIRLRTEVPGLPTHRSRCNAGRRLAQA